MNIGSHLVVIALASAPIAMCSASVRAENVRVRGTIQSIDGDKLAVKSRDGNDLKLVLRDDARINAVVKASLADVKAGANVMITSLPRPDGTREAYELRIAQAGRPFNTFSREWDLMPNTAMTNGSLETSVASVDGQELRVKYKVPGRQDAEQRIIVTPKTIIARTTPASRSDLKPGLKIYVDSAPRLPDGSLDVSGIQVEKEIAPAQ